MAGVKGKSGRKSKAEEFGLQALLDKCWTVADREKCLKALAKQASSGEMDAVRLLMSYAYGKPLDRKEIAGKDGEPVRFTISLDNAGSFSDK